MTAIEILNLLRVRHSGDVFVDECKDGPTFSSNHLRMDAWVMRKSWSKPCVTGYEIKCSRSDFLRDDKFHNYFPYCNVFYFVCVHGLIQPTELQDEAGLLWVSKTGNKLYIKKRAPYRDVTIPESLYRYILMSRAQIKREYYTESNSDYWAKWLQTKAKNNDLGCRVSSQIRRIVNEAKNQVRDTKHQISQYDYIVSQLKELGIDTDRCWSMQMQFSNKLDELRGEIPPWLGHRIRDVMQGLKEINEIIEEESKPEKRSTE